MAAVALALVHPVAPVAWWAVNSPMVHDALHTVLGGGSGSGDPRQLQSAHYVDEDGNVHDYRWLVWIGVAVGIIVPITIWTVGATVYKNRVTMQRPPLTVPPELSLAGKEFKYPMFSCCDDCQYCLHGMFVGPIRAADNFHTVGASTYWAVMTAFLFTWLVAQLLTVGINWVLRETAMGGMDPQMQRMQGNFAQIAWYVTELFLALWFATLRKKLRVSLGDTDPGSKFCCDFLTYWWCSCCNVIQEARQIDEAEGVRVECCCNLLKTATPVQLQAPAPVVGNAVVVGQVVG